MKEMEDWKEKVARRKKNMGTISVGKNKCKRSCIGERKGRTKKKRRMKRKEQGGTNIRRDA